MKSSATFSNCFIKRIAALLLCTLPCAASAQINFIEDFSLVHNYVNSINEKAPYHDDEHSFSVVFASFREDERFVMVIVEMDEDCDTAVFNDPNRLLQFFVNSKEWDIRPLANQDVALRVNLSREHKGEALVRPTSKVGYAHTFSAADIRKAINRPTRLRAQHNLSRLAAEISSHLPSAGEGGEVFYACQYDADSLMFYMVFEYPNEQWDEVKRLLSTQGEALRESKLEELANSDSTNGFLGHNLYAAEAAITYVYLNRSHSESAEFTLTPGLLDPYWEKKAKAERDE